MLRFAREVAQRASGRVREDLGRDRDFQIIVERLLELVGEAARGISAATRAAHPDVPWQAIVGMRNILAHDYGEINYGRVWVAAEIGIPDLIAKLERIVAALPPPE